MPQRPIGEPIGASLEHGEEAVQGLRGHECVEAVCRNGCDIDGLHDRWPSLFPDQGSANPCLAMRSRSLPRLNDAVGGYVPFSKRVGTMGRWVRAREEGR